MGGLNCYSSTQVCYGERRTKKHKVSYRGYQDYSRSLEELDRYDSFYHVVCAPLHAMHAVRVFTDLDRMQRQVILERQAKEVDHVYRFKQSLPPQIDDSDHVPFDLFLKHIKSSDLWRKRQVEKHEQFMRLLNLDGLFLNVHLLEEVPLT